MRDFQKEDPELTSLFRWAVIAGILLWIAMSVASSAPPPPNESQAAAAAAGTVTEDPSEGAAITDNNFDPVFIQCRIPVERIQLNYACNQEGTIAEVSSLEQPCRPGFNYVIKENRGTISVTTSAIPDPRERTMTGCPAKPPTPICSSGARAIESTSLAACQVTYCAVVEDEELCREAETSGDGALDVEQIRNKELGELALASGDPAAFMESMNLSPTDTRAIYLAFEDQVKTQVNVVTNARRDYEAALDELAANPDMSEDTVDTALARLQAEEARLAALRTQQQRLAAAQARLEPPAGGAPVVVPPTTPAPVYTPGTPQTFPGPTGGTQFPPRGEEQGGFTEFMQGFFNSLFGGGGPGVPPAGNQDPQAPGTCTPKLLCDGNLLYQRNTQCVDAVVEQCQYGCNQGGTACVDAPPAPTAQISCQPLLADAGMSVVITHACSGGTSVGSGFSTGGKLSGATSTVLATPQPGQNNVTFGLTCTNQGVSANASCNVQVAKPGIVLVANPQTVAANEVSVIGWVTAGMQKCTISSPDQADFTERNASRTSVSGVASTSPITVETDILLKCTTIGGNTREATTTISIQ